MGTFADSDGRIVGTPFKIGTQALRKVAPAGASYLLLGINDDTYADNSGSFQVEISEAPAEPVPGVVVVWGSDAQGQTDVPCGLQDVVAVACGDYHTLALKADGTVVMWGAGGAMVPAGLTGVVAIASGANFDLGLLANGTVVMWRGPGWGIFADVPADLTGVVAVAAGIQHAMALKSDGTVVVWGANDYASVAPPEGLAQVVAIAAAGNHWLALKGDGTVVAWGGNWSYENGWWPPGGSSGQSEVPFGLSEVVDIASGTYHSVAVVQHVFAKATPQMAWSEPAGIVYGTALDHAQLNATADVPGVFVYSPPAGTVLGAGFDQVLSVTFTPADVEHYEIVTKAVLIDVLKATPEINWSKPADLECGSPLTELQLNAVAEVEGAFVQGTFVYTPPAGTVLSLGNDQVLSVSFSPDDPANSTPASGSVTINVVDTLSPVVGPIIAPVDPVRVTTVVNMSANFIENCGPASALWDWGDGSASAAAVSGTVVNGSHTYTLAGVYTVTLTLTDEAGNTGQSVYEYVVVYDPDGGFVTGGGWITSPAGAYRPDPALAGKATFGFNSKYKPGATVPTGQTQFGFHTAGLNFHSESYDWLVVGGAKARYKGSGTINGGGNYGFLLTAIDGQVNGGGGLDKFRIKIWDKASHQVVYDNQMDAPEDADPTTALGGGSIVIHKKK